MIHTGHRIGRALVAVFLFLAALGPPSANALTASLFPDRDNTMFFASDQELSSGAGTTLFFGVIASGEPRRALMRFDLSGIPPGSTISSVTLRFIVLQTPNSGAPNGAVFLHRALADWGEGTSFSVRGRGEPATPGDASWRYRFYPTTLWTTPGGVFVSAASATLPVPAVDFYTIPSNPSLVADVKSWVDAPTTNFGWVFLGTESNEKTARQIGGRSAAGDLNRPLLTVTYTPPGGHEGGATTVPFAPPWALAVLALVLAGVAVARRP